MTNQSNQSIFSLEPLPSTNRRLYVYYELRDEIQAQRVSHQELSFSLEKQRVTLGFLFLVAVAVRAGSRVTRSHPSSSCRV
eukprot:scaffold91900_cov59-Attheya_sp.AAC.11